MYGLVALNAQALLDRKESLVGLDAPLGLSKGNLGRDLPPCLSAGGAFRRLWPRNLAHLPRRRPAKLLVQCVDEGLFIGQTVVLQAPAEAFELQRGPDDEMEDPGAVAAKERNRRLPAAKTVGQSRRTVADRKRWRNLTQGKRPGSL